MRERREASNMTEDKRHIEGIGFHSFSDINGKKTSSARRKALRRLDDKAKIYCLFQERWLA